jgi:hypothetical protein
VAKATHLNVSTGYEDCVTQIKATKKGFPILDSTSKNFPSNLKEKKVRRLKARQVRLPKIVINNEIAVGIKRDEPPY